MAAPTKTTSRWGSFLQQAVAGVESKLDDILADEPRVKPAPSAPARPDAGNSAPTVSAVHVGSQTDDPATVPARSSTPTNRTSDRLQDRLAKALAAKNASRANTPITPRSLTPPANKTSPRPSADLDNANGDRPPVSQDPESLKNLPQDVPASPKPPAVGDGVATEQGEANTSAGRGASPRASIDSAVSGTPRASLDAQQRPARPVEQATTQITRETGVPVTSKDPPNESNTVEEQAKANAEKLELARQEELHGYIERIDTLQAKLKYLAKETADAARAASSAAPAGSLEKKLAEKEEQVALLLDEGQQLSKKEVTHLTTIKKLRVKLDADAKLLAQAQAQQEKAERELLVANERCRQLEAVEKESMQKSSQLIQLQKEADRFRFERDAGDEAVAELKSLLEEAIAADRQAEVDATNQALEKHQKRVAELEDDVSNLKIEKELVADRAQKQVAELKEKLNKAAEESQISRAEMKVEQQMLESRLEVMRARAEEASSGAGGDAQAKLLRQIETLQTQYAVASENWQGIETSLLSKATALEKERDEALRKEAEIRRKAREAAVKFKHDQEALVDIQTNQSTLQAELEEQRSHVARVQKQAEAAEAALRDATRNFDKEKSTWAAELQHRIEDERARWQEEASERHSQAQSRAESPALTNRKGLTSELLGIQNIQNRRPLSRSSNAEAYALPLGERRASRRQSTQPLSLRKSSGIATPDRQESTTTILSNSDVPETPSTHAMDADEFFEHHTSASPQQTINDIASASTAAAGPSVQLVERMSSAVRRLESEKVASKEDGARLAAQRDEARAEMVALMKEVEVKRAAEAKVAELEAQLRTMDARYQTTLEMLGEKSELVEELRGDVVDLKAMYRDLVERTVQ